ncbi:CHASE3 domain-containing protein [Robertmurraya andreesenii]|uniref:CHASE3 domain sensor protein n=1 Tax=Anoxybacillus andreesenii TaxID=1325932 RepID=A0ABT9V860_9BACL|nr:CHASE3 domain-containing protein [Robertmurraya andreesenii]MDQ0157138.1 CHASE3 domain sensor protein [Robertmurraya andreesenii]
MAKRHSIKFKLGLSIIIIIGIFSAVSTLAVLNFGNLISNNLEDKKSWEVLSIIDGLQETTREAGITIQQSDESPSNVINNLRTDIDKDFESLYSLTADNSEQQQLLKKSEHYINDFYSKIEDIITSSSADDEATLKNKIMEAARPADMTGDNKTDEFQDSLTKITDIENAELLERDNQTKQLQSQHNR